MKSKDLKKILQYEANQIPIGQYQNEILSQVHQKDTNSSFLPTKKKTIGIWLSSSLAIVACVCIVAFAFIFNRDSKDKPHPFPTPQLSKAKQLLSYEMVALGNMVEVQDSTLQIKMKQDPTLEQQALVNEIHEYLITGEMMLNKEGLKIQNQANNDVEYANYAYKLVAQYQNSTDYILYYNEQTLWEEDKKEEIHQVSSHLEGILIKENIPFQVEGKKEVENDEYECELVIYEDQTRQNYIKINQETEINENEYE